MAGWRTDRRALTMCQWVAVALAGDARCNCTWDAIGPLKPGERRPDGHPDIGPPRQTFAFANVHALFLSKAPYRLRIEHAPSIVSPGLSDRDGLT